MSWNGQKTACKLRTCRGCKRILNGAVVSASGSAPAYVYIMIEAMADAAVMDGMPRAKAYQFAAQAVVGAAKDGSGNRKTSGRVKRCRLFSSRNYH